MRKLLSFLIPLLSYSATANEFKGFVLDSETRLPLEYVNVGVVGKGIGTVTDEKGFFSIPLPDSVNQGTVRISCIGYQPQSFEVAGLGSGAELTTILLQAKRVDLTEVVIRPKVFRKKVLGNTNNSRMVTAGFQSNDLGSELGTIMKIRKAPTFIEDVGFNVGNNTLDSIIFRMNIYTMKDGQPDSIILKTPVYVSCTSPYGTLKVDLKPYNLVVTGDFFVSLEWIRAYGLNKIYFCAGLMDANSMYRKTSQDKWAKSTPVGIGFYSTVSYEK